ncbi:MAG: folate-binding protein [Candidatus Westeberhardia cardiocondylae]|nr:folate-binding protein [Candidatus Westeberhardia cardiocondylae]
MTFLKLLPNFLPIPSQKLPLTLIYLYDWVLVTINEIDAKKYLQGQFTCDLLSLKKNHFSFSGQCNETGKILSTFYVFNYKKKNSIAYITRKSIHNKQINQLLKYSIFSQIKITTHNDTLLIGLSGKNAINVFKIFFHRTLNVLIQPVMMHNNYVALYFNFPIPRFLLITYKNTIQKLQNKLKNFAKFRNSKQWLALDIEAKYPIIDDISYNKFFPQDINLQYLNGINFNKGCYIGQEMIMKYQYKKNIRFSLYFLISKGKKLPLSGENLEINIQNQWYFIGKVLTSCKMINNNIWIQAILKNQLISNNIIRTENQHILCNIHQKHKNHY